MLKLRDLSETGLIGGMGIANLEAALRHLSTIAKMVDILEKPKQLVERSNV